MYKIENNIYVKETGKYGKSLFAKRDFKKNELVFIPFGPLTNKTTIYTIPIEYNDLDSQYLSIDPTIPANNLSQYICHSCNPNLGVKDRTMFVALRDIKKDEEVNIDYAMIVPTFEGNISWEGRKCLCGRKNCRKIAKGYFELSKEEQQKYDGYVSEYIFKMKNVDN